MKFMLKKHTFLFILLLCISNIYAQVAQRYTIEDEKQIQVLDFTFFSPTGESFFTAVDNPYLVKVNGDFQEGTIRPKLSKSTVGSTQKVQLELSTIKTSSSVFDIFSTSEDLYNRWNIYFTKEKKLNLQLVYGYGKSYLDLANLSVQKLKIITSGADIIADYSVYAKNPIKMDSLLIIAELGKIVLNNMHLYNAQKIHATVDFGTVSMDFSRSESDYVPIKVIVGGGTYKVTLPKDPTIPVQIKIH